MDLDNLLKDIQDIEFHQEFDLTKLSTMRLKSSGPIVFVKSLEALKTLLPIFKDKKVDYTLLGWGANQLLPTQSESVFVKLQLPFDKDEYLKEPREEYDLPASVSLSVLTSHASKHGLKGWEVFTGIPASLGGAIFMNAGTNLGEIGEVVKEVTLIDNSGDEKVITIDENSFSYRNNNFVNPGDVIVSAKLVHKGLDEQITTKIKDYLSLRNTTQPLNKFTCGCIFKNYSDACRAGQYIDIMGLKGLRINDVMISQKHANFFENKGGSDIEDVKNLIKAVQYELKLNYGLDFETEVEFE